MKKIFIWLDDERPIYKRWEEVAKSDIEFKKFTSAEGLIEWYKNCSQNYDKIFISFDHDLGNGLSGYDVAKWIVETQNKLTGFWVHSMNPVGARNIGNILIHYGYKEILYLDDIND